MPRDFVPCLYTERALPNAEDYGACTRCEAIELFALSDVVTQKPGIIMTLDSHAYQMDAPAGDLEGARNVLFYLFSARLAALE